MVVRLVLVSVLLGSWTAAAAGPTVPLNDQGASTYLGFQGGLYPEGINEIPVPHLASGMEAAGAIQPLDTAGRPSTAGKIVLLSVGMSNTTQEFCSAGGTTPCASWSFVGQAMQDPAVNHQTLVMVNGARGGQTTNLWSSPTSANWDRVRDTDLKGAGLTEAQVQVAWLKEADSGPTKSLLSPDADAYLLESLLGSVVRSMRTRYPNLKLVFLSSRIYAGYASSTLNPEPYAWESGLSVKWLVEAQIRQEAGGAVDPRAGDLRPGPAAPWIGWGPYLWANGTTPRSDGLVWQPPDFQSDGTHPSQTGQQKVGGMLLSFFRTHLLTRAWFLSSPPQPLDRRVIPTVASASGRFGSYFRTSLQLHNPSGSSCSGRLVFHAQGQAAGGLDPVLPFALGPGETRTYDDLFAAFGVSGVGSLDLLVDSGATPLALARVFNDAGEAGTTGVSEEALSVSEALKEGDKAVLLVPADLAAFRLNVGARSMEGGAAFTVTVRNPAGTKVGTVTLDLAPDTYLQQTAQEFLKGLPVVGGESLTVDVSRGPLFLFGATADNRTQDPSLQIARRLP